MEPSYVPEFTLYTPSRRLEMVEELKKLVPEVNHVYFDENNSKCFSHIVNTLIIGCPTEYMIFLSDKARPLPGQIQKMKEIMLTGKYGLVALHRFGGFCIDKDVIRRIGFFDERYVRGGFEDDDFMIRLREANIAVYESEEMPLVILPSSFNYDAPYIRFKEKWAFQPTKIIRMKEEESIPGEYLKALTRPPNRPPSAYLDWDQSQFLVKGHHNHKKYSNSVLKFITTPIHTRLVPPPVETLPHINFLILFGAILQPKVYVEYGVRSGTSFNAMIAATRAFNTRCIGIDASPVINQHPSGTYYQMTTDDFADHILPDLGVVIDMAFVDADHSKEQVFRDVAKLFPYLAEDGLIFMHDTYPLNDAYTDSSFCHDAYHAAWRLRQDPYYRDRAEILTIPVHPGLTIIRKACRQLFWRANPASMYDIPPALRE